MAHDNRIVEADEIELEEDDALIVFCPDANYNRVVIPDLSPEARVPKNVLIATAIGLKAFSDPLWVRNLCVEVMGEQAGEYFDGDDLGQGPPVMGRA